MDWLRLLRRGEVPSAGEVEATLGAVSSQVRAHLQYASRPIADLALLAASAARARRRERTRGGRPVTGPSVDGVLVEWGERLFYPRNRIVRAARTPRLSAGLRASGRRRSASASRRPSCGARRR